MLGLDVSALPRNKVCLLRETTINLFYCFLSHELCKFVYVNENVIVWSFCCVDVPTYYKPNCIHAFVAAPTVIAALPRHPMAATV